MLWRSVFFLFALPPLLAAFLLWWLVPEPPSPPVAAAAGWTFRRVAATPARWILGLAGIMPVYLQFMLATWGPLFSEVGVSDLGRSALCASLQGVGRSLRPLHHGLAADRAQERGVWRRVIIALTIFLAGASIAGMGGALQARGSAALVAFFMMATSFFLWGTWGPAYALLAERFPPSILGSVLGLYNTVCFVGGVVGPFLTGWIKQVTGSFASGCYGAAVVAGLGAAAAMAFPQATRPPGTHAEGVGAGAPTR